MYKKNDKYIQAVADLYEGRISKTRNEIVEHRVNGMKAYCGKC